MKVLSLQDVEQVSGGLPLWGYVAAIAHEGAVSAGLVGVAWLGGLAIGNGINALWEASTGQSIGGSLFDFVSANR